MFSKRLNKKSSKLNRSLNVSKKIGKKLHLVDDGLKNWVTINTLDHPNLFIKDGNVIPVCMGCNRCVYKSERKESGEKEGYLWCNIIPTDNGIPDINNDKDKEGNTLAFRYITLGRSKESDEKLVKCSSNNASFEAGNEVNDIRNERGRDLKDLLNKQIELFGFVICDLCELSTGTYGEKKQITYGRTILDESRGWVGLIDYFEKFKPNTEEFDNQLEQYYKYTNPTYYNSFVKKWIQNRGEERKKILDEIYKESSPFSLTSALSGVVTGIFNKYYKQDISEDSNLSKIKDKIYFIELEDTKVIKKLLSLVLRISKEKVAKSILKVLAGMAVPMLENTIIGYYNGFVKQLNSGAKEKITEKPSERELSDFAAKLTHTHNSYRDGKYVDAQTKLGVLNYGISEILGYGLPNLYIERFLVKGNQYESADSMAKVITIDLEPMGIKLKLSVGLEPTEDPMKFKTSIYLKKGVITDFLKTMLGSIPKKFIAGFLGTSIPVDNVGFDLIVVINPDYSPSNKIKEFIYLSRVGYDDNDILLATTFKDDSLQGAIKKKRKNKRKRRNKTKRNKTKRNKTKRKDKKIAKKSKKKTRRRTKRK